MTTHPRPRPLARAVAGAALALATTLPATACASNGFVPAAEAPPLGGSGASPLTAAPGGGLATTRTALGTVVTTDGFTVYRLADDSPNPSASTCDDECAAMWPPVLGDGVPALQGVPSNLIGTVGRPDGTQQLTLAGWPLYRYARDTTPGDVKGDGVGGVWKAIGVDGRPASAAPSSAALRTGAGGN